MDRNNRHPQPTEGTTRYNQDVISAAAAAAADYSATAGGAQQQQAPPSHYYNNEYAPGVGAAVHHNAMGGPNNYNNNYGESYSSFAPDGDASVPLVAVAAAPKDDTLYDSLLRYHNENDSTSTEDSSGGGGGRGAKTRRRNPKVSPYSSNAADPSSSNSRLKQSASEDDLTVESDQKLPALPIPRKKVMMAPPTATAASATFSTSSRPPQQQQQQESPIHYASVDPKQNHHQAAPPPSMTAVVHRKKPPPSTATATATSSNPTTNQLDGPSASAASSSSSSNNNKNKSYLKGPRGSFYEAALLEASVGIGNNNNTNTKQVSSEPPAKMPGIVQVSEPAIRTDSVMYRAAYGGGGGAAAAAAAAAGGGLQQAPPPHLQQHPTSFSEPMSVHHDVRDKTAARKQTRGGVVVESKPKMMVMGTKVATPAAEDTTGIQDFQKLPHGSSGNLNQNMKKHNMGGTRNPKELNSSAHSSQTYPVMAATALAMPRKHQQLRSSDGAVPSGAIPPEMLRNYSSGAVSTSKPLDHMMNIGNDEHIGLPSAAAATTQSHGGKNKHKGRSPIRIGSCKPSVVPLFFQKRSSAESASNKRSSTAAAAAAEAKTHPSPPTPSTQPHPQHQSMPPPFDDSMLLSFSSVAAQSPPPSAARSLQPPSSSSMNRLDAGPAVGGGEWYPMDRGRPGNTTSNGHSDLTNTSSLHHNSRSTATNHHSGIMTTPGEWMNTNPMNAAHGNATAREYQNRGIPNYGYSGPSRSAATTTVPTTNQPPHVMRRGGGGYATGGAYPNSRPLMPSYPPIRDEPSLAEQSHSTASSSMDEEMRLALEISKQDIGAPTMMAGAAPTNSGYSNSSLQQQRQQQQQQQHRYNPSAASSEGGPLAADHSSAALLKQSSFGRDVMAYARDESNNSLADLMLALKLSAEESSSSSSRQKHAHHPAASSSYRRASTNLDQLLAFEMAQDSRQNMTDFVAAGITTAAPISTPATSGGSITPAPPPSATSSGASSSKNMNDNTKDQDAHQLRILKRIREEHEQRELELALKASEQESKRQQQQSIKRLPGAVSMNQPANHYLYSQKKAMEDWTQQQQQQQQQQHEQQNTSSQGRPRMNTPRQNSMRSIDSEGRRRELLERGTSETKLAIESGQAHMVICHGCEGRLQAPVSYSLVFCPKCHTISPA